MTLTEIRKILATLSKNLQITYGVTKIGVFGSYAREEAASHSDIDILVEFSRPIGWEIVDLQHDLEDALGIKVDVVTNAALKPQLKSDILKEVVYI